MSDLLGSMGIIIKRVEAAAQVRLCDSYLQTHLAKKNSSTPRHTKNFIKYRSPTTPVAIIKGALENHKQ